MKSRIAFSEVLGQVIRKHRGSTPQSELAESLGVSTSAWSRLESGKSSMTIVQLRRIAGFMGLSAWTILQEAERISTHIEERWDDVIVEGRVTRQDSVSDAGRLLITGAPVATLVGLEWMR